MKKLSKIIVMGAIASTTLLTMSSWKSGDEEKKETADLSVRKTIRVEREVTAKEMHWFEGYHESDYLLLREGNLVEFFDDTKVDADYIYIYIVK